MMENKKLNGKRVAVLVEMGFEQIEFTKPAQALKEAGASVFIISPHKKVKAWNEKDWGEEFNTDVLLEKAEAFEYDALLLPGGVLNPDKLRVNITAVKFVKSFMENGKPIAAICHAPWTLIETGMIENRKVTSYPSVKTDLENAGAIWSDEEVVTDNGLVTSRNPEDIPAFNKKMIEEFAEGVHSRRKESDNKNPLRAPVKNEGRAGEDIRNKKEKK